MRYTDEQNNLADGMALIIKLYYCLKEIDKDKWLSEPIVRQIAELAYKVTPEFKNCLYLKSSDKPRLKFFTRSGGVIYLTKNDFQKFVDAMNDFTKELKMDTITVLKIDYHFSKWVSASRSADKNKWTMPKPIYRDSNHFSMKSMIPGSSEDRPGSGHYEGMFPFPLYHETIHVDINRESSFAKSLYRFPNTPHIINAVSPYSVGHRTFMDLVRFFFAKYIEVFKSFDRIGLCEYESCKKLIFNAHSNKRRFCNNNDVCKLANHKSKRGQEKYDCQQNQNRWIRGKSYQLSLDHYTVYKEHCDKCDLPVHKGGECQILRTRNEKLYAALEKKKNKPRKSLHSN